MADYSTLIPVNVVTGFLGSGKTTLLQRLLASPELHDAAVLINEFGEVGLDHHLVQRVPDSNTVVMASGCLCCTIRGDLTGALGDLFSRRERAEIPAFRRVLLETTGLADPTPVAFTLLADPVIQHHFRLGNIIATLDAVNGLEQLERYPESVKQAAIADRLVLTKTDLTSAAQAAALKQRVRRLNGVAPLFDAAADAIAPQDLLLRDLYDPAGRLREISELLEPAPAGSEAAGEAPHDPNRHDGPGASRHGDGIYTFSLIRERPMDWTAFGIWMTLLLHRHGTQVLRIKGILNVRGMTTPVAIHGVRHLVHPPAHLPGWPNGDRRSRIVFIVDGLPRRRIEDSLAAFLRLADDGAEADAMPAAAEL